MAKKVTDKSLKEKKEVAEKKEAVEKKEAIEIADDEGAAAADSAHDDKAQDVELIKKMIAEYIGDDGDVKSEEMDEADMESKEKLMAEMESLAKEAYEAHMEMGCEKEEAMEKAKDAVKLAHHMAKKAEAAPADDGKDKEPDADADDKKADAEEACEKKESDDKDEDDKKQESDRVKSLEKQLLEAKGVIAKIKAKEAKVEVERYVDTKLSESKLSKQYTKSFLEAAGEIKSKEDFDSKWKIFTAAQKDQVVVDYGLLMEKAVSVDALETKSTGKSLDFSNVAE